MGGAASVVELCTLRKMRKISCPRSFPTPSASCSRSGGYFWHRCALARIRKKSQNRSCATGEMRLDVEFHSTLEAGLKYVGSDLFQHSLILLNRKTGVARQERKKRK